MEFEYYKGDYIIQLGLVISTILTLAFGLRTFKHRLSGWLTAFFLVNSLIFLIKVLHGSGDIIAYPHLFKLDYPLRLLRPVLLFFYVYLVTRKNDRLPRRMYLHFVAPLLMTIYIWPILAMGGAEKVEFIQRNPLQLSGYIPSWLNYLEYALSAGYIALIIGIWTRIRKLYPDLKNGQKRSVNLLLVMGTSSLVYLLVIGLLMILGLSNNFNYFSFEILTGVLIIMLLLLLVTEYQFPMKRLKLETVKRNGADSTTQNGLMERIRAAMESDYLYLQKGFRLRDLSIYIEVSENLISQTIKEQTGAGFRDYLNKYRIEEAKKRLLIGHEKYTIESIAKDVGFNSRASFYNAFEKTTQQTPMDFIKANRSNLSK